MLKLSALILILFLNTPVLAQVKGVIDSAKLSSNEKTLIVSGWACDFGKETSIRAHLYANGAAGKGKIIGSTVAKRSSESGVGRACGTKKTNHRFVFLIPRKTFKSYLGAPLYVHGITDARGGNLLIGRSGNLNIPKLSKLVGIKGNIDSVSLINNNNHVSIRGWACDYNENKSIKVHIYAKPSSGRSTFLTSTNAAHKSEGGVSNACGTKGTNHRFNAVISRSKYLSHIGKKIYVHGISVSAGENLTIDRSGELLIPDPPLSVSDLKNDGKGNLTIPKGGKYTLDKNIDTAHLIINGELVCGSNNKKFFITAKAISVYGKLTCGTAGSKFKGQLEIRLKHGLALSNAYGSMGQRGLFVHSGGEMRLHGIKKNHSWLKLQTNSTANKGKNYLMLEHSVDWKVGDNVAISSTGYYGNQAEDFKITRVLNNGRKIVLDGRLKNHHLSKRKNYRQNGKNMMYDSRAVVANLTRNIRIYPYGGSYNSSELGGHVMVMPGGKAYVDSVEFTKMGRKGEMARYPFHWHMLGDANGQYIRNSSIHDSFQRCITLHATNNTTVDNNICYNHFGHGFFLEDGSEVGNTIKNNVGFRSKRIDKDKSILISDTLRGGTARRFPTPSTYWISNPQNIVTDNIAAGSEGSGFWMAFENRTICNRSSCSNPLKSKTLAFHRNTAHSNKVGITWDGAPGTQSAKNPRNSDDRVLISAHYRPPVATSFDRLSVFKNREAGIYVRGNAVTFTRTLMADNAWGAFVAYSQHFKDSVVVGNSGFFSPLDKYHYKKLGDIGGVIIYDGPFELENVGFYSFPTKKDNSMSHTPVPFYSIGGANRFENKVKGLTFSPEPWARVSFDTKSQKNWSDSFNSSSIKDLDGSLSGVKGALIVPRHRFNYQRGKCTEVSKLDGYICKNNYKLGIIKLKSTTTNAIYTHFTAKNIDGVSKFLDKSKFHSKMNVILDRKDGFYSLNKVGQFADDKNYQISFHTEGIASSPVVRIDKAGNCSIKNTRKVSSLNALHNTSEGYFLNGGHLYFKVKSKVKHPTHARAKLSNVYYTNYNVSCR